MSALTLKKDKHQRGSTALMNSLWAFLRAPITMTSTFWRETTGARRRARQQRGVVYLHAFPRSKTTPLLSPSCAIVESFLRAANIPYVYLAEMNPGGSPTGRFPFIELDGVAYAETHFILRTLMEAFPKETAAGIAPLSPRDRALTTFVRRTLMGSIRNGIARHIQVDHPEEFHFAYAEMMPWAPQFLINMIAASFRRESIGLLNADGYGDLTETQYLDELDADLAAIENLLTSRGFGGDGTLLGSKYALGGTKPTELDAQLFGWLQVVERHVKLPGFQRAQSPAIRDYLETMRDEWYPDYAALRQAPHIGTGAPAQEFNKSVSQKRRVEG